jgi:2-polyprenyl-3-methyl-5-hydroxy-6-metoxy-1,4-benzoquinol methylase
MTAMDPKVLDWLVCPHCGSGLAERNVMVQCEEGHRFPIVNGVARLNGDGLTKDAQSIHDSFSREWSHFDYERDRTWGETVAERKRDFLRHTDLAAEDLEGKLVLDAGCGNGALSNAISEYGCEVLATDIGGQVERANEWFAEHGSGRVHYAQADLMRPPFKAQTFDVILCAGVLHHTPNTKATFQKLVPALKPGGTIFVWLYHHVPGPVVNGKLWVRKWMSRMPAPVKHAAVIGLLPQSMLRQEIRIRRGKQDPATRLNRHEKLVTMLDSFTCRYRWEHTPEELAGWYRELGYTDIKTTEVGQWGFGVVARRPPVDAAVAA